MFVFTQFGRIDLVTHHSLFLFVVEPLATTAKKLTSTESAPTIPLEETETVPNILEIKYTPTVLMRYPKTNYSMDEPFPAYAAMVR